MSFKMSHLTIFLLFVVFFLFCFIIIMIIIIVRHRAVSWLANRSTLTVSHKMSIKDLWMQHMFLSCTPRRTWASQCSSLVKLTSHILYRPKPCVCSTWRSMGFSQTVPVKEEFLIEQSNAKCDARQLIGLFLLFWFPCSLSTVASDSYWSLFQFSETEAFLARLRGTFVECWWVFWWLWWMKRRSKPLIF